MRQRALLTLGQGDWQQGFASITLQLWEENSRTPIQFSGSLPAAPRLYEVFQQWRSLYHALCQYGIQQRSTDPADVPERLSAELSDADDLEIDAGGVTHVSTAEFIQLSQCLHTQLNGWLEAAAFRSVDRQLRTHLSLSDEIRVILTAERKAVLGYPWHLWQLFEDYPHAELALGPINYQRSIKKPVAKPHDQVSVLAVLGDAQGIDVKTDQQLLASLPGAAVTLLAEPSLDELHQQLWQGQWDIFCFAGHSSSQGQGILRLNQTDAITVSQLKYALRTAIAQGLQLAIFNSCDGLGLAWDLADLHIPQVIVMREPVADEVAHAFLKHFLIAFAADQPLYLAVRAAREQLQPLEPRYPCATWLPVIVQNPAELPMCWHDLKGASTEEGIAADPRPKMPALAPQEQAVSAPEKASAHRKFNQVRRSLGIALLTTSAVIALRLLGGLAPVERYAFDWLMRLRPAEQPDPRLLVVTISEADIRAQPPERRGSLSDRTLARLLAILDQQQARLVGLDVYRDYPVSDDYPELANRLQTSDRIVGVCKSLDSTVSPVGVDPPPELTEDLVGFSDFLDDVDGVVRRHLVALEPDPASTCTTPYAFSARLAFLYLQDQGITPSYDTAGNLVMGEVVSPRLRPRSGGYQSIDAGGNQIMLNYRALPAPSDIANQVSLTQLLEGQVNPQAIANRIVLIGVTATSLTDAWATPYGQSGNNKTAGVFLQAQMTSQLISAALGERPVLQVWPLWGDMLWISGWAAAGWVVSIVVFNTDSFSAGKRAGWGAGLLSIGIVVLTGGSLWLLTAGYWVPLVPAGLAFGAASLGGLSRGSMP